MLSNSQHLHIHKNALLKPIALIIFAIACMIHSSQVHAKGNYHVEVIVFKQLGSNPGERSPEFKNLPSFSSTWQSKNVYLNSIAARMRNSGKYQILTHTAWGQKSASYNRSAAKRLSIAGLNGFIKVFATQLLFTDVKLNFEGHSVSERRRLKLNEVHYFDNEGFGVLIRVSRG